MRVIAIDGPAGSGKSTVARAVARRLDLDYLDTGAMYRSVAWMALQRAIDPSATDAVAELAAELAIEVGDRVLVDGIDATAEIRTPDVTRAVTAVAANPGVRKVLVGRQRAWAAERGGGVVEGRDIGTVVFPEATLKVFLTANESERMRRRHAQSGQEVAADIVRRDRADAGRSVSPLAVAEDAIVIDTTSHTVEEIVEEVLSKL